MNSRRIYRYEVPADGHQHVLRMSGQIVHADARESNVVEVWALAGFEPERDRYLRVYRTGEQLPGVAIFHHKTVIIGWTVWHLIEGFTPISLLRPEELDRAAA